MYNMSQKRRWDNQALLDYARQEGAEKERKEAEKVRKELEEKLVEARQKSSDVIANLIRQSDMDDQTIAGIADVPIEVVRKLRTELEKKQQ